MGDITIPADQPDASFGWLGLKAMPSQSYLAECLSYDPHSGLLRWRVRPVSHFKTMREWKRWNKRFPGLVAGTPQNDGYRSLSICGIPFKAHRVIWKLVEGNDPPMIDHKDGDGTNNRFDNLRLCTGSQNAFNSRRLPRNTSGVKGVSKHKRGWTARAMVNGHRYHLGYFETKEAAATAYAAALPRLQGDFAPSEARR